MSWRMLYISCLLLAWIALTTACSPITVPVVVVPTKTLTQTVPAATHTATLSSLTGSSTSSPANIPATSTALPAIPAPRLEICSPLQGYGLAELPDIVSNPFHPPAPGSDDPHQGVDLAHRLPGSQAAVSGMEVLALLPGQVAGVIADHFPYGYAVLLETPLVDLPLDAFPANYFPEPPSEPLTNPALTCPELPAPYPETSRRSLYILYAHLETQPLVGAGQKIGCGESLGVIGQSGNALHPHLHVEARVGPAGARFASMAHYDNQATQEEMGLYCLWRVSGVFQLLDPLVIFALQP